jgi:cellulase
LNSPVQVYIAENKNLQGNVWTKVASEGFSGNEWATDKLIKNKGKHSFTFPHVPAGEYIVRPEILALHEGDRPNGAQFYMACIQVKVSSGGGSVSPLTQPNNLLNTDIK